MSRRWAPNSPGEGRWPPPGFRSTQVRARLRPLGPHLGVWTERAWTCRWSPRVPWSTSHPSDAGCPSTPWRAPGPGVTHARASVMTCGSSGAIVPSPGRQTEEAPCAGAFLSCRIHSERGLGRAGPLSISPRRQGPARQFGHQPLAGPLGSGPLGSGSLPQSHDAL